MNKTFIKSIAVSLCALMCLGGMVIAYASPGQNTTATQTASSDETQTKSESITKDETVYVLAGADGSVKKIIVSDWIKNTLNQSTVADKTDLKDIENVKGDESYTVNSENMKVWDAKGNDIYYKGNIEKELPVGLSVSYKLDGKSISAEDLAGKSGKVTLRFDYKNRQFKTVSIDGKQEKIYVPFVMLTGMLLDNDIFSNVSVSNGKVLNDGDRYAVVGIALPGLQENLGLEKDKIDIPDFVEITADAKNFSLGMTVTLATNELFNDIDTSKIDSLDSLTDSVDKLGDAMDQLLDGSSALYGGICTLLEKSDTLVSGINDLAEGAKAIKDGADSLDDGAAKLKSGLSELSSGLDQLTANNDQLNGGAKEVFETLLSTADTQIAAAGITAPKLTIEKYAEILNEIIASLDETAVYNEALKQVTAAVEQQRDYIKGQVTNAVRVNVEEKVIPLATGGQFTRETYLAALDAGKIPQETQAQITGAVDLQMASDEIQQTIAQQTQLTVEKTIAEQMASDEVQQKLKAASEGAKALIALKASLDKYNAFYLGLQTYTAGVSAAAKGAKDLYAGSGNLKSGTEQLKSGAALLYNGVFQLKNGAPALVDGVGKLKEGSLKLSEGLKQFNDEGIGKIVSLLSGDVRGAVTRFKATVDVSKDYRNFSGIGEKTDGQVKFIYRTDEIKK